MADALRAPARPGQGASSTRRLSANERRQQLFAVALELFAVRGYRATTMDDIAEAAGVTKPLVYQHFSSKRALYLELVESVSAEMLSAIAQATASADGPRQQVELGFAAYFRLVVTHESAFRLLYGREEPDDAELGHAMRQVEDAIAEAIDPLISAGLDPEHRRFLAYAVVGMAEGASRQWLVARADAEDRAASEHRVDGSPGATLEDDRQADRLAQRLADLAWAGLRSVHAD
jgi:AcrR family transcriptional regulator